MKIKLRLKQPTDGREAAAQVIYRCLNNNYMSELDLVLRQAVLFLDPRESRLATAIVYGTLTRLYTINYLIDKNSKKNMDKLDPWLKSILQISYWQLKYANNMPAEAICNEACELVKKYSHVGNVAFANAVLRKEINAPTVIPGKNWAATFSLLPELAGCFKKWFGDEQGRAELSALLLPPPLTIRTNLSLISSNDLKTELEQAGIEVEAANFIEYAFHIKLNGRSLTALPSFKKGHFFVQGESAMLIGDLCRLQNNYLVIDLCSAPGGKITHLAEKAKQQNLNVRFEAWDINPKRLVTLSENVSRLNLSSINNRVVDATDADDDSFTTYSEKADLVLVDVPCSGMGLIARKPELRWNMTYEKMNNLLPVQAEILQNSARLVRTGGRLIYSTCTLNPAENQDQVQAFLASEFGKNFTVVNYYDYLPSGLKNLLNDDEINDLCQGYLTLRTCRHGAEGFFIAVLARKS